MTDEEQLASLIAVRATLEAEIASRKNRLHDIGVILNGTNDVPGLAARVRAAREVQAWRDDEPRRAQLRSTEEWQAWHIQFRKGRKDNAFPK